MRETNYRCEFYEASNQYCTAGQGSCMHRGDETKCKMKEYYDQAKEGNPDIMFTINPARSISI